ncbi:MAG: hypothetical protein ACK5EA_15535 [Planctomycetaceae bacterium]|jgi:hypothetical protein
MSGKQLTGTLEGMLDGLLDGKHSSASLSLSGDLMINGQAVPVTARGDLAPALGGVQPSRGIAIGTLVVTAQDSEENLIARFAMDGKGGDIITDVGHGVFDGIEAASFIFERGVESSGRTLPIKMIFQHSSTVATNQVTGEFQLLAHARPDVFSFDGCVKIEMRTGNVLEKHEVRLQGEVTRERSPEGTLRFESSQGELGVSLSPGNLQGAGLIKFQWSQLWATGIFKGCKQGSLWLRPTMSTIDEYDLKFRLG